MVVIHIDRNEQTYEVNLSGPTELIVSELAVGISAIHQGIKDHRSKKAAENFRGLLTIALLECPEVWKDDPEMNKILSYEKKSGTPTDQS